MKDKFNQLKRVVEQIEIDVDKFNEKNNKSAGLRVRKSMLEVKTLAQEIRKHILDKKNSTL
jgi:hypothetical protein